MQEELGEEVVSSCRRAEEGVVVKGPALVVGNDDTMDHHVVEGPGAVVELTVDPDLLDDGPMTMLLIAGHEKMAPDDEITGVGHRNGGAKVGAAPELLHGCPSIRRLLPDKNASGRPVPYRDSDRRRRHGHASHSSTT